MARITKEWIEDQVVNRQVYTFPDTMMTVCCITLKNGFNTVGMAACANPAIFNQALGNEFAYEDALSKIWPLEGYRLKQKLHYGKDVSMYPT